MHVSSCDVLGYSYAPVLLNARAILKCKANLNSLNSFPVVFLFLEGSCMRQIRNIFGLTSNDFSPTSNGKALKIYYLHRILYFCEHMSCI